MSIDWSSATDLPATEIRRSPAHWQVVRLGDLFDIQQGKALSRKTRAEGAQYPFLRTANVRWGHVDLATVDTMGFTSDQLQRLQLRFGDLLVCEGGDIGRTAIWRGEIEVCGYQNHLHRLRPLRPNVVPDFFMYWMQAAFQLFGLYAGQGNKTTIPNLSRSRLASFAVPLPPLPEQRAIAQVLRTAQQAKEATEAVTAAARELKRSLMRHLFTYGPVPLQEAERVPLKETEIGPMPKHWHLLPLRECARLITKGSSPNWQGFQYCSAGIPFVRSQNVGCGRLDLAELAHLATAFNAKQKRSIIEEGDLLLNIVGASIGRAAVASGRVAGGNVNQAVAIVRLKPDYTADFLAGFLLTDAGQEQMHRQKKDIARANLSLQDIGNLRVPVPALGEQAQVVSMLRASEHKLAALEKRQSALEELFRSLLEQLMTRRVTPRLPNVGG